MAEYEAALKERIVASSRDDPRAFEALMKDLRQQHLEFFHILHEELKDIDQYAHLKNNLLLLLRLLDEKDMLPAIVFHFDRSNCESLAKELNKQLTKGTSFCHSK